MLVHSTALALAGEAGPANIAVANPPTNATRFEHSTQSHTVIGSCMRCGRAVDYVALMKVSPFDVVTLRFPQQATF